MDRIAKRRARQYQRLVRHDIGAHESDREHGQENDPDDGSPDRMPLEQKIRGESAKHEKPKHDDQRVFDGRLTRVW